MGTDVSVPDRGLNATSGYWCGVLMAALPIRVEQKDAGEVKKYGMR
jgi:hypothetical protein